MEKKLSEDFDNFINKIRLNQVLKDDIITKMILGIWLINALCKAVEIYKGDSLWIWIEENYSAF